MELLAFYYIYKLKSKILNVKASFPWFAAFFFSEVFFIYNCHLNDIKTLTLTEN